MIKTPWLTRNEDEGAYMTVRGKWFLCADEFKAFGLGMPPRMRLKVYTTRVRGARQIMISRNRLNGHIPLWRRPGTEDHQWETFLASADEWLFRNKLVPDVGWRPLWFRVEVP